MNIPSFPSIKSTENDRKSKEGLAAALKEKERRYQRKIQSERGGLLEFVRWNWPTLEPATPFVEGWAFNAICQHLEAVTFGEINRLLINVPPGFSKALDVETPILTTWGWKRHGDIRPGDFVFGPDGQPKRVLGISTPIVEPCYEIEFDDGAKIIAGPGHLWEVERDFPYGAPGGRRCRKTQVVSTPDLMPSVKGRTLQRPDRIPVAEAIALPPKRLLIDPYLLGAWLGDGSTTSGCIYTAHQDIEHFQKFGRIGSVSKTDGKQDFYRIVIEELQTKLRIMGLLGNKHIPQDYMEASIEQRWELLRGLMDTDGCATKTGHCTYSTKLEKMGNQILSLACSLGIKAHISSKMSKINGEEFGPYYHIVFTAALGMKIFNLDRKGDRLTFAESTRSRGRYIQALTEVPPRLVNCISVEDRLYVAGERFITTHNSLLTQVFWPAWEWSAMDLPSNRYVTFSYSAFLTERDNDRFCKLIQSERFNELWGDKFKVTAEGKVKIANNKTGWKFASSVGGVGTGERGDRVVCDDSNNVIDVGSSIIRGDTNQWFEESVQNRLNDLRRSSIIVISQRVHEDDVSGLILEKFHNYCHLVIPMCYEADRHCITEIGWSDPRTREGELACPERFPESTLTQFKSNEYLWAGQYQQRPQLRGSAILKSEYWQPWDEESSVENGVKYGLYPPFEYVVGCLDTAMTEKKQNDPSAFLALGVWRNKNNNRRIMLIYAWTERFEFHDLINQIVRACKKCKITLDKLLVEAKANGHSVEQELRRLHQNNAYEAGNPLALTSIQLWNPGRGDKVSRAMAIQPIMERRVVFYPTRTGEDGSIIPRVWAQAVERQASSFPRGKHDDLVDCLTMGLAHLRLIGMIATPEEEREVLRQELSDYKTPLPLYPGA